MKSMMRIQLKREMNLIETNHHINIASDHPVSSNDSFKSFLNAEGFNMVLALLQLCEAPWFCFRVCCKADVNVWGWCEFSFRRKLKTTFIIKRSIIYRDGDRGRKTLGIGNCSINIWDGSELELAWLKKKSSYFENNFPILLLSGISNTSIFKVCDILHWVNLLLMKIFTNIFRCIFCWSR